MSSSVEGRARCEQIINEKLYFQDIINKCSKIEDSPFGPCYETLPTLYWILRSYKLDDKKAWEFDKIISDIFGYGYHDNYVTETTWQYLKLMKMLGYSNESIIKRLDYAKVFWKADNDRIIKDWNKFWLRKP